MAYELWSWVAPSWWFFPNIFIQFQYEGKNLLMDLFLIFLIFLTDKLIFINLFFRSCKSGVRAHHAMVVLPFLFYFSRLFWNSNIYKVLGFDRNNFLKHWIRLLNTVRAYSNESNVKLRVWVIFHIFNWTFCHADISIDDFVRPCICIVRKASMVMWSASGYILHTYPVKTSAFSAGTLANKFQYI